MKLTGDLHQQQLHDTWWLSESKGFPAAASFRAAGVAGDIAVVGWYPSWYCCVSMSIVQCPCYLYWHCILSALTHTVQRLSNFYCRTDLLSVIGLSEYRTVNFGQLFGLPYTGLWPQMWDYQIRILKISRLSSSVHCYRYIQGKLALTISMHRRRILCTLQFPLHF